MRDKTRYVTRAEVSTEGYDSLTVPVYRASTIRYPDAAAFAARFERDADSYVYGLYGTPTHRFLEKKITELHQGVRTVLAPSGQAAVASTFLALLKTGQKVLIPDPVYGAVRNFADNELTAMGIEVVYYDPADLNSLRALIDSRTRLVWVESPGSITMEMQDLPAIVEMAHAQGVLVGCDNTWASPLNFKPLAHGADIVVEALSKHFCGHSDVLMGSVTVRDDELGLRLKASFGRMGVGTSPDDCVLVLRGTETLAIRLAQASASALDVAAWLRDNPLVQTMLHPGLEGSPGHEIWKRDFSGCCGVFSFTLRSDVAPFVFEALDALQLIAIGASWGGTKSLLAPSSVRLGRTAKPWLGADYLLRLSVGLEDVNDIKDDLTRFLDALNAAAKAGRRTAPSR
jgi:cystathionine beta-lyase